MQKALAKLKVLKDRTKSVQELHNTVPEDIFYSLRDQFYLEMDKLKAEHKELQDFSPQNYEQFYAQHQSYYRWATRALVADIDYFINFLKDIENIQLPNVSVLMKAFILRDNILMPYLNSMKLFQLLLMKLYL